MTKKIMIAALIVCAVFVMNFNLSAADTTGRRARKMEAFADGVRVAQQSEKGMGEILVVGECP